MSITAPKFRLQRIYPNAVKGISWWNHIDMIKNMFKHAPPGDIVT